MTKCSIWARLFA